MKTIKSRYKGLAGVFAMAMLTAVAGAQCLSGAPWRSVKPSAVSLMSEAAHPGSGLLAAAYRSDGDDRERSSIVGMWHVHLVAQSTANLPDLKGVEVDAGYQQWHSDKTEMLNSGRPPANGNFCMGVWEQTGTRTYRLNHFAMGWTQGPQPDGSSAPTNNRVGPSTIVEEVTVSPDGKTFAGTFTITDYQETDLPSRSSISFLDSITGTITGTRIDINTPASPIF